MATERRVPSRKPAATNKPKPANKQAELRAARAFAMKHNFGLSSRVREMLDEKRDIVKVLVDENLPITKVQEFIREQYGPKIGLKALNEYIEGTFRRPTAAPSPATKPATKKKATPKR